MKKNHKSLILGALAGAGIMYFAKDYLNKLLTGAGIPTMRMSAPVSRPVRINGNGTRINGVPVSNGRMTPAALYRTSYGTGNMSTNGTLVCLD